jgi:hypothetical protein
MTGLLVRVSTFISGRVVAIVVFFFHYISRGHNWLLVLKVLLPFGIQLLLLVKQ